MLPNWSDGLRVGVITLGLAGFVWAEEVKGPAAGSRRNSEEPPPPVASVEPEKAAPAEAITETDIIRERYPNKSVRVERHVALDAQQNFVNHGSWSWWDEKGQLLARGVHRHGKQQGTWIRIFHSDKGTMFTLPLYKGFERPFTSEATFEEGMLQGTWTITDAKSRKVSQAVFEKDRQHGPTTWWHPNGQVRRQVHYLDGKIDGDLRDYAATGELVAREVYVNGFKMDVEVSKYPNGRKRAERAVQAPTATELFNWFEATFTLEKLDQEKVYDGPSVWWYADGQKEMVGNYDHGVANGQFTWWHANGQERSRGQYVDGKQEGKWTWWYANGQRELEGHYHLGQRTGKWASWNEDGKIRLVEEHPNADDVPPVALGPNIRQASSKGQR